jgi:hypothetical protein
VSVVPLSTLCFSAPGQPISDDDQMLSAVAEALANGAGDRPVLVGLVPQDGAIDLHLHPIPHGQIEAVIGWQAPSSWRAAGVVGPATSTVAEPCSTPACTEVSVAVLVDRLGRVVVARAGRAAASGDTSQNPPGPAALQAPQGRLVDVCQRVLQLPTTPCSPAPGRLWTAVWFDTVLTLAIDRSRDERSPHWRSVADCHPLPAALRMRDALRPEHLIQLVDHPLVESWEALRLASIAGEWHWPDTPATAAQWFDAGSFGRWLLHLYLPPIQLLAALGDLLAPSVHAAMHRVGEAWQALDDDVPGRPATGPSGEIGQAQW